jgi:hypothetical protein
LFFDLSSKLGIIQIIECGAHDAATSMRFTSKEGTGALAIEANHMSMKSTEISL